MSKELIDKLSDRVRPGSEAAPVGEREAFEAIAADDNFGILRVLGERAEQYGLGDGDYIELAARHAWSYFQAGAALEAELARLRAGQEPVALQVVAHTQGNLMKSIGHFTDCRTDEGVTVGLIDTIINSARLLATRNLNHPAIVEAIKDLCGDSDVLKLVSPQPSCGRNAST